MTAAPNERPATYRDVLDWLLLGVHGDEGEAEIAPFDAVPLSLAEFWLPDAGA